jgi:hypothetical protein
MRKKLPQIDFCKSSIDMLPKSADYTGYER